MQFYHDGMTTVPFKDSNCSVVELRLVDMMHEFGSPNPNILQSKKYGKLVFWRLNELMLNYPKNTILFLDFTNVYSMTASFADESLASIAVGFEEGTYPHSFLVLKNLDAELVFELDLTLRTRPERQGKAFRNLCLPYSNSHGSVDVIGKFEGHLFSAFRTLNRSMQLTARELAYKTGLELNASSSKLKNLYDLHLAFRTEHRDETGKYFVYQSLLHDECVNYHKY